MKVVCYTTEAGHGARLCADLVEGFKRHGVDVHASLASRDIGLLPADLTVIVGVRRSSYRLYKAAQEAGQQIVMLDKGYFNRGKYHRISVGSPQPSYISKVTEDSSRFDSIMPNATHHDRNGDPRTILYVESTQKYYNFHELGDVTEYSANVCAQLRTVVARAKPYLSVVYRPRKAPTGEPLPVPRGTVLADPVAMRELFKPAHCVVVHGSNAGVEALVAGVPVVSLGNPGNNPIHDLCVDGISDAVMTAEPPSRKLVNKRCAQLAWCQFSHAEISSGFAWEHTKQWVA